VMGGEPYQPPTKHLSIFKVFQPRYLNLKLLGAIYKSDKYEVDLPNSAGI
jgi:hypothetical protein